MQGSDEGQLPTEGANLRRGGKECNNHASLGCCKTLRLGRDSLSPVVLELTGRRRAGSAWGWQGEADVAVSAH